MLDNDQLGWDFRYGYWISFAGRPADPRPRPSMDRAASRRDLTSSPAMYPSAGWVMREGTTTQRGYGWSHQKARARALDELVDGDPCPYCHEAMTCDMDLDYDHYPPLAMGGTPDGPRRLAHSSCNRRAGQAISASRRRTRTDREVVNSRAW